MKAERTAPLTPGEQFLVDTVEHEIDSALQTARLLWLEIDRTAENEQLRRTAQDHLAALDAREQILQLDALLARYREREGHAARSLQDLVTAGLLQAVPRDPSGAPYVIGEDGRIGAPDSKVDLRLLE